jgi:hypothetical protein
MVFFMPACRDITSPVKVVIPMPDISPISTPTFHVIIEPTPTEWLPYNTVTINDGECKKLVPTTIPVVGTENLTNEEIAGKLFSLYLEKHISLNHHHFCKLENYRIEKIISDKRINFLSKEQEVDFVNWVVYSVQIKKVPSSWVAGNGEFAPRGWIVQKIVIIGVSKLSDEYVLKLIGTGP